MSRMKQDVGDDRYAIAVYTPLLNADTEIEEA